MRMGHLARRVVKAGTVCKIAQGRGCRGEPNKARRASGVMVGRRISDQNLESLGQNQNDVGMIRRSLFAPIHEPVTAGSQEPQIPVVDFVYNFTL